MNLARRTMAGPLAALLLVASAASATAGSGVADPCAGRGDVLGVSRIVEIDTEATPRFGAQYGEASFLEDGEVVLTFDDGPLRHYSQRVLDALEQHCAKATFFIVGRMAIADPEMLKEMARRGHTIGVHTWSHKKLPAIGAQKAKDEIELGLSATAKALGAPVAPFFRFPYLRDSKSALGHLGERKLGVFGIDIDSRDFSTRSPAEVQRTVLRELAAQRKGILLFHDIQPSTAGALASLLTELKARGFRIVHMVAKAPAMTLPEYDAIAGQELAEKVVAAAKSPLATRSLVWPNGKDKAKGKPATPASAEPDALPWLQNTQTQTAAEPPAPPPPRPKSRPAEDEDPWQLRSMGR